MNTAELHNIIDNMNTNPTSAVKDGSYKCRITYASDNVLDESGNKMVKFCFRIEGDKYNGAPLWLTVKQAAGHEIQRTLLRKLTSAIAGRDTVENSVVICTVKSRNVNNKIYQNIVDIQKFNINNDQSSPLEYKSINNNVRDYNDDIPGF